MAEAPFGDPTEITERLIGAFVSADRIALDEADLLGSPAVYALGLGLGGEALAERDVLLRCLPETITSGQAPAYIGAAANCAERARRHQINLDSSALLAPEDFWIVHVPMPSTGAALYAEELLQLRLRPLFCEPRFRGLGSKHQGANRQNQRPSPFDCLFERAWAPPPTVAERTATLLALATVLVRPEPVATLWSPLELGR